MKFTKQLLVMALLLIASGMMAQVPSVQVENSKGEKFNTSVLVDNKTPFIVSFWSTVCKPCLRELDAINELMPDWKDEVEFRLIAVSTDDSRSSAKAKALAEGRGWDDFHILYDKNQEFMRSLNVSLVPQVFIFDANGKMIYSHTGYTPGSEAELLKILKENNK